MSGDEKGPVVILHGLLGSKRNWLSLSKAMSRELQRPIYALDLRNHGSSPHVEPMNYTTMANDVLHFLRKHSLSNVSLIGHSMGGKVAMATALSPELSPNMLSDLIVVDITPSCGSPPSGEFPGYFEGMQKIEDAQVSTRQDAQTILTEYEEDPMVRAFLLTNLLTVPNEPARFKVPLRILENSLGELADFPQGPGGRTWKDGQVVAIKGKRSKYVNKHNFPIMQDMFPGVILEELDTGHWVHSEAPRQFLQTIYKYIK
ncbi:alpha beta-hydrolase [Thelephora ganbajun]|uniref:Alpha beta-hydrolase n=1 Tax=Thelephora ganbajun TaxID=370292 RepID=A0ACB6Z341_THEGA|nr:alpha beta-hydrolase [Thelephora ganbajun]